jgi:hypothetical protein
VITLHEDLKSTSKSGRGLELVIAWWCRVELKFAYKGVRHWTQDRPQSSRGLGWLKSSGGDRALQTLAYACIASFLPPLLYGCEHLIFGYCDDKIASCAIAVGGPWATPHAAQAARSGAAGCAAGRRHTRQRAQQALVKLSSRWGWSERTVHYRELELLDYRLAD